MSSSPPTSTISKVHIRPATADDAHALAPLLFFTGPRIFHYLFFQDQARVLQMLAKLSAESNNEFSHTQSMVAEVDGEICGLMHGMDPPTFKRLDAHTLRAIIRAIGLFSTLVRLPKLLISQKLSPPMGADEYHIKQIAVDPNYRSLGIGKLLIEEALRIAGKRGLAKVMLDVEIANERGIRFYEREGFEKVLEVRTPKLERSHDFPGFLRMGKSV